MSLSSDTLVESILSHLEQSEGTFCIAESCTCGLLCSRFSARVGISKYFLGGAVSYANEVKESLLDVKRRSLKDHGAVSSVVALEMARGAKKNMDSTWAVSVTGIAGPDGGTADKPVGTVYFAVVGPNFEEARRQNFSGSRQVIQKDAVDYALRFFLEVLNKSFIH